MTPDRQSDYIRSDELADAAVRVGDLPKVFNVARSTIDAWLTADSIRTFEHPAWDGHGRAPLAARWGDIPVGNHPTRWNRRANRK